MKFDDILIHLGEFGRYQQLIFVLISIPAIFGAMMSFTPVFMFGEQQHRCRLPGMWNDTYVVQNEQHMMAINGSIPTEADGQLSKCYVIKNSSVSKCSEWVYDDSMFTSTVISQFNLVCKDKAVRSHMTMLYFGGFFVGALTIGTLSDTFGRKPVLCVFLLIMFVSSMSIPWAPNMTVFGILRFFNGFTCLGSYLTAFILAMELVGPSKRLQIGTCMPLITCIGQLLLCLFAYFIRDWHVLQIAISVPMAGMLVYWWIVPESPRWLMARGRKEKAMLILKKVAKKNKVSLQEDIVNNVVGEKEETQSTLDTLKIMIKTRHLLIRWLIVILNWSVISMTFYGLTLNVGNLSGDIYVNFLIITIVGLVGYASCLFLMDRLGRKRLQCGSVLIGGLSCLVTLFPIIFAVESLWWIITVLAMVGKLCISAAFVCIYIYTTELFPTVIRGFVMGSANICARVATMMCPYIVDLGMLIESNAGKALPLIVFGSLGTITAILSLLLPETLNVKLPETIEDILEPIKSSEMNGNDYNMVQMTDNTEHIGSKTECNSTDQ